ncbi:MAG: prenyltransferase/squalene oxidase repeat-containing protein [Pseudomonadota bacterium]
MDQNTKNESTRVTSPAGAPCSADMDTGLIDPSAGRHLYIHGKKASATSLLQGSIDYMKSLQRSDGYWWFALEANETIGAEFIFLMHYLQDVDKSIQSGIGRRILDVQRKDGSWALYHDGPGDLSTSVECYFALKLAGFAERDPAMTAAKNFILSAGGAEKARVFTRIHLAMFGLMPWDACPAMPAEFIFLPKWFYVSIYSFSSWARATIVPLLMFMCEKKVIKLPVNLVLDEIFLTPPGKRDFSFSTDKGLFSFESFFIYLDKLLKLYEKKHLKRLRKKAIERCKNWIWERVNKTEDIYPPLAYCALAYKALGYDNDAPQIKKPFNALKMFQQRYATTDVPALPDEIKDDGRTKPSELRELRIDPRVDPCLRANANDAIHQQCCISPIWDTPWMIEALLEAGVPPSDPALLRAGNWLIAKQITEVKGDWAVRNPKAEPGGWAFEFENDFYPDVDDTIEVLTVLCRLTMPWRTKERAIARGINWLLSMQNDDGGWGAFDRNQTREIVNKIPFSDHKACLDPSSPDITGRMVEFLIKRNFSPSHPAIKKAIKYIWRKQEDFGGWFARWGVNYIYGTWCVLSALGSMGIGTNDPRVARAVQWLASVQRPDGGFSEAPDTYDPNKPFAPYNVSVPSQTAWALMGLVGGGATHSNIATKAALYLLNNRNESGSWDEMHYTGTGFPLHFYIRYHGYRHYFPLLALARYFRAGGTCKEVIS